MPERNKYFGVVEGFYRRQYTHEQRCDLIKYLASLGLDTYVYGPKSDIYHRKKYHGKYPASVLSKFRVLNELATEQGIMFNYALSPGSVPDIELILDKIMYMQTAGISDFSLFFDDISVPITKETALEQSRIANRVYTAITSKKKGSVLFFCPTQYRGFVINDYIRTIGDELHEGISVFWTGKRVVSLKIMEKEIDRIKSIIKRPPLIWDNLFANDYMPGVILRHPYRYREPGIVSKVNGILINPMNQYVPSKLSIYTAAKFFKDPFNYVPRKAWQEALNFLSGNA